MISQKNIPVICFPNLPPTKTQQLGKPFSLSETKRQAAELMKIGIEQLTQIQAHQTWRKLPQVSAIFLLDVTSCHTLW